MSVDAILARFFSDDCRAPYYNHLRTYAGKESPSVGDMIVYAHPERMHPSWAAEREVKRLDWNERTGRVRMWVTCEEPGRLLTYDDLRYWRLIRRGSPLDVKP